MTTIVIGNWRLDEGQGQIAGDSTGNRNDGQLNPTPGGADFPIWTGGRKPYSTALQFDGGNSVKVANNPTLTVLDTSTVTAEAWVRSCGPGKFGQILTKGALACLAASYALYSGDSGGLFFYIYRGSDIFVLSPDGGTAVWDGNWHHVAGTYDGLILRLYVDGTEIGTGTPNSLPIHYHLPFREFYIGAYVGTCQLGFKGDIAEVRVWNGALSAGEILARAQGREL